MRDKLKDKKYWLDYISFYKESIPKFVKKLEDETLENKRKEQLHYAVITRQVRLVYAQYSLGVNKDVLSEELEQLIKMLEQYSLVSEEPIFDLDTKDGVWYYTSLLALVFLLGMLKDTHNKLAKLMKVEISNFNLLLIKEDSKYLYEYFNEVGSEFYLDDESSLVKFCMNRLEIYKNTFFYNYHLEEEDLYFGYWAFEVAAIVKVLGLDEDLFSNLPHYPKF